MDGWSSCTRGAYFASPSSNGYPAKNDTVSSWVRFITVNAHYFCFASAIMTPIVLSITAGARSQASWRLRSTSSVEKKAFERCALNTWVAGSSLCRSLSLLRFLWSVKTPGARQKACRETRKRWGVFTIVEYTTNVYSDPGNSFSGTMTWHFWAAWDGYNTSLELLLPALQ